MSGAILARLLSGKTIMGYCGEGSTSADIPTQSLLSSPEFSIDNDWQKAAINSSDFIWHEWNENSLVCKMYSFYFTQLPSKRQMPKITCSQLNWIWAEK